MLELFHEITPHRSIKLPPKWNLPVSRRILQIIETSALRLAFQDNCRQPATRIQNNHTRLLSFGLMITVFQHGVVTSCWPWIRRLSPRTS